MWHRFGWPDWAGASAARSEPTALYRFVGRHWSDRALLDLAERLESVSPVRGSRP